MRIQQNCKHCNKELQGRTDKKYCNQHCKSAYQYQLSKEQPDRFYNIVDNQLKLNRKILKEFNKGGKVTVRATLINKLGFVEEGFSAKYLMINGQWEDHYRYALVNDNN